MAEPWCKAFGRYLKTLRERRGLSLQEVCSLSQAFTETLNKGYLSRCENGHQGVAFSKVIPLGRIYGVPADVLLERLELDMELDRLGGPETEEKTFEELTAATIDAISHGYGWDAYGYARDSISRAGTAPLMSRHRNIAEQVACSYMNCATSARLQGRKHFPLHEFKFIESTGALGPRYLPVILERLSLSYRVLHQLDLAEEYGQKAQIAAESLGDSDRLGYVYSSRAQLALAMSDLEAAADLFRKAYAEFRKGGPEYECPRTLNNLAQVYFDLGRIRASRRMLVAAERLASPIEHHRARALGRILMGEIDALEHKTEAASKRWREAADIAKKLNDKVLRFKAEFFLFRQAHEAGDYAVARSLHRRLRKLSNWVPKDTPELAFFQRLVKETDAKPN